MSEQDLDTTAVAASANEDFEPDHTPNDDEIFELYAGVKRCAKRHGGPDYHPADYSAPLDPHSGQGRVLLLLKSVDKISQTDLARIMGIRPQSLSGLLAKLEAAGYVARTPNERDRRAMDVAATEKGRAVEQRPRNSSLLATLDERDRRDLVRVLNKINAVLKDRVHQARAEAEARGEEFDGCPSDRDRRGDRRRYRANRR